MATFFELEIDSLTASFEQKQVLRGVYCKIRSGRIVGIIGRNGCGKSTLYNSLYGTNKKSSETVRLDGIFIPKKERFKYISYLPQLPFLPGSIKVKKAISILVKNYKETELIWDERIQGMLNKKIWMLSGGEQRYLEIHIIASLQRPFIVLDEPFTKLEPIYTDKVCEKLKGMSQKGIIISDHNIRKMKAVCDEIHYLDNGILREYVYSKEER